MVCSKFDLLDQFGYQMSQQDKVLCHIRYLQDNKSRWDMGRGVRLGYTDILLDKYSTCVHLKD